MNDEAVFAGDVSGTMLEDDGLDRPLGEGAEVQPITGTLTATDFLGGTLEDTNEAGIDNLGTDKGFRITSDAQYAQAQGGVATIDADGNWAYTPNANFNGPDSFTVLVTDDLGNVESQVINVTVEAVADLSAADDAISVDEDGVLEASVADNDSTISGGALTYALAAGATTANGELLFNEDGSYTYTPNTDYYGPDSFSYVVTDAASGESSTQTVTITVNPVVEANSITIDAIEGDSGVAGDFQTNDTTLTVSGSLEKAIAGDERVEISTDGGATWTTATVDGTNWSFEDPTAQDASFTFKARIAGPGDSVGATAEQAVTIDTVVNVAPPVVAVSQDDGVESPDTTDDFVTNVVSPTVSGSATLALDETLQIQVDGGAWVDVVVDAETGVWNYQAVTTETNPDTGEENDVPVVHANGDAVIFTTRVVDDAGNVSEPVARTITIDTSADTDANAFTVTVDEGFEVTNATESEGVRVTLAGIDADAASVAVTFSDGAITTDPIAASKDPVTGVWTVAAASLTGGQLSLADGEVGITAVVTDGANNTSTATNNLELDTSADVTGEQLTLAIDGDFNLSGVDPDAASVEVSYTDSEANTVTVSATKDEDGAWTVQDQVLLADGTVTVSAVITDAAGNTSTATDTLVLDVTPPTILASDLSFNENTGSTETVVATFTADELDGDVSFSIVSGNEDAYFALDGASGEVTLTQKGLDALNDDALVDSVYSLVVVGEDAAGNIAEATATVNFVAVNDAPKATFTTAQAATEDAAAISGQLTSTDADTTAQVNATTAEYSLVGDAISGLTLNTDGSWSFDASGTAYQDLSEGDTRAIDVNYLVTDDQDATGTATFTVTVTGTNDAPVATFTTAQAAIEDAAAISGQLTSTDADTTAQVNATTAEYSLIGDAISGLTLNTDGSWSFDASGTAYQDLSEGDTRAIDVNYLVTDDQDATGTATFTVTITGTNDVPVANVDTALTTEEDTAVTTSNVLSNDTDVDGDSLSVSSASASNGSVTINADGTLTYNPNANYNGNDTITYTVSDGFGGTDTATIAVTVNPVADLVAVAAPAPVEVLEDGSIVGTLADNVSTESGGDLTFSIDVSEAVSAKTGSEKFNVTQNKDGTYNLPHGTLALADDFETSGNYTYSANADYFGMDSFSFTVTDASSGEQTTLVETIEVAPVNDAPTTTAVTLDANAEDSGARVITQAELLVNASDIDSATLTAESLSIASGNGTLDDNEDGTWTYTPALNDDASVSFSYSINDGDGSTITTGSASLDITPVNDAPTTSEVTLTAIAEDSGVRVITAAELLGNASDDESDTLTVSNLAANSGTLTDNGDGTWDFTPASNDDTSVTFSYTITDDGTTDGAADPRSVTGSATLDLTPVNDAPTTSEVTLTAIAEDSGVRVITAAELLGNASDDESDTLTVSNLAANSGTLTDNGDGTWDFTPASNDDTSVTFSYTITDDGTTDGAADPRSVTGSATLDLTPVNDAPLTDTEIGAQSADDADAVNLDVSGSFSDADNDTLTYSATGLPGGLSMSSAGVISGTIDADASQGGTSGVYSVTVTASDSEGGTTTSTFDYTVSNVAPVTDTEIGAQSADDADAVNLDVSGSFSDADNDTLTYSATGLPGGLSMSSAGVISGTIDADASQGGTSGVYSVTVTASDSEGGTTTSSSITR